MNNFGKQTMVKWMRKTGILPLAEITRREIAKFSVRRANRRFCIENAHVAIPPPELSYDPLGSNDYAWYWATGRLIAQHIHALIQSCAANNDSIRVLEWGCGPARIIRHLAGRPDSRRAEYFGTDYNAALINWCRSNLVGIDFRTNDLTPPLDYSDGFFDFVYCLSVFTHLSEEMHHARLAELLRVTKAGRKILISLHGNNYSEKLLPDELIKFNQGELVVRGGAYEGSRMYASFHGEKFVRDRFLKNVDVSQSIIELTIPSPAPNPSGSFENARISQTNLKETSFLGTLRRKRSLPNPLMLEIDAGRHCRDTIPWFSRRTNRRTEALSPKMKCLRC